MNNFKKSIDNRSVAVAIATAFLAVILVAGASLSPSTASARAGDQNGFSLGLILGDPSGLTLRGGIGESSAIQAHIGFSPFPGDALALMVDWTYDAWDFLRSNPKAGLLFFFGFGGKAQWFSGRYFAYEYHGHDYLTDRRHFGLGARALLGLRLSFRNSPFDLFLEIAPVGITFVVPDSDAYYDIDGAIGFRYRF
jgi:hypothetical protein